MKMLSEVPIRTNEVVCAEAPKAVEDVNEFGYLAANPDVRASGVCARDHFESVGLAQGRYQAINIDVVLRLRERKLAALSFLAKPRPDRERGEPVNFLSAELVAEFAVPEAPPISAHPYPDQVIKLIRDNPAKLFLDVGAGVRPIYYANVVNTEIYPSFSTDVLCVGEEMPFASDQFDFVFCFATLEHTKRPWDVSAEICRVLKPGGMVMIDYPFMQPVHGYPHHYFNATPMGNRSLFERACDIQSVDIGWHHHPMIGLQWMLTVFHRGLQPMDAATFGNLQIKDIVDQPLDALLKAPYSVNLHAEMQRVIASGSLLKATKKVGSTDLRQREAALSPDLSAANRDNPVRHGHTAAEAKIEELTEQNAALRVQQQALLRSTSWRVTSPLRACLSRLRGRQR
jgi:SAM-dependent methyltransferase